MILVLASHHDEAARGLVADWPAGGAVMTTCQDLLTRGWAFYPDSPQESVAVADGCTIRCSDISGVLTLRPSVLELELSCINLQDRPYVCAEVNAFLIAWLSHIRCPVLNRPTATSLSGPNWSPERWIVEAGRLGIPVEPRTRKVPVDASGETSREDESPAKQVCVIGGRALPGAESQLERWAAQLAERAGVEFLEARFRNGRLIWAGCWPDLSRPEIRDALIGYFA